VKLFGQRIVLKAFQNRLYLLFHGSLTLIQNRSHRLKSTFLYQEDRFFIIDMLLRLLRKTSTALLVWAIVTQGIPLFAEDPTFEEVSQKRREIKLFCAQGTNMRQYNVCEIYRRNKTRLTDQAVERELFERYYKEQKNQESAD